MEGSAVCDQEVVAALERIVSEWAAAAVDSAVAAPAARLVPYGSSCLPGVSRAELGPGTDLDLLCLVPSPISREAHFFGLRRTQAGPCSSLAARLRAHPSVRGLVPVSSAFVPCLKFVFAGIPIDLTFCALPADALGSDFDPGRPCGSALASDPPSARSLAAVHTARALKEAVPCAAVFGKLYVAVRLWAGRRGVHGKHLGFPCGVSWAVLCAAVCQRSPTQRSISALLRSFFATYATWEWPRPVQLLAAVGASAEHEWCASPRDVMPIVTPATLGAAAINSTHTVTRATLSIIEAELHRAARLLCGSDIYIDAFATFLRVLAIACLADCLALVFTFFFGFGSGISGNSFSKSDI